MAPILLLMCAASLVVGSQSAVAAEAEATVGPLSFKSSAFPALDVQEAWRPFYSSKPRLRNTSMTSVVMRVIDGVAYDMALRQAESGYAYLNSYQLTHKRWYLVKARAQADHLIAIHHTDSDGWFFPSTFRYSFNPRYGGVLVPPWYSGIAQGAAVGFFARLWEATGDPVYRNAADHTLESFLVPETHGGLWISRVDSLRYLRLEEYPDTPWEFVFNGHMEAAMGLYDHYRVTRDPRALALYQGALTSVLKYGDQFRNHEWISAYSLGARATYRQYHQRVVSQMLELYTISGDRRFIHLANSFDADYPAYAASGTMRVIPGVYMAYRFASTGAAVAARQVVVRTTGTYRVKARGRVRGQPGYWLTVQSGSLAGYSLREITGHVYLRGAVDALTYRPPLRVTLNLGRWKAQKIDSSGSVIATRTFVVSTQGTTTVGQRAIVNGATRVLVSSGSFAGYWVSPAAVVMP